MSKLLLYYANLFRKRLHMITYRATLTRGPCNQHIVSREFFACLTPLYAVRQPENSFSV